MRRILLSTLLVCLLGGCSAAQKVCPIIPGLCTPTPTASPPPMTPTPTTKPGACCGDCNGDQVIQPSEVSKAVAIKAGSQPLTLCPVADCDGDTLVTDADLSVISRNVLEGCGCCGDCDGDGAVKASEVGKANAIANGTQPLSLCPAADCNHDGTVRQSEVDVVTKHNLNGCPR